MDAQKLRIYETWWPKHFLSPIRFNKNDAIARCILCKTVGAIFAADVVYHKNCMTNFTIRFQRDINETFDDNDEYCEISVVRDTFLKMVITRKITEKVIQYLPVQMYWTIILEECSLVSSVFYSSTELRSFIKAVIKRFWYNKDLSKEMISTALNQEKMMRSDKFFVWTNNRLNQPLN